MRLKLGILIISLLAGAFPLVLAQVKSSVPPQAGSSSRPPQTYTHEGVSVEFSIEPIFSGKESLTELRDGAEATVRFKIVDANAGRPLANLRPAAWISQRDSQRPTDARECREKIKSFLQPSFNRRANIDLNSYFILALNHEPNISVIDPLFGFGGSKLYTLIPLPGTGEDWVMSSDQKRLFVSIPALNQVAVIDTAAWKVIANIDAGAKPARLALQHDGRYLWVGNDGGDSSGATVIDTVTLKVAAGVKTGKGHHEIAFTEDDSLAFITNKQDGTLSVADVRKLALAAQIKVGSLPAALVFSPLGKVVYVASEGDGTIAAVDGTGLEIVARMNAKPGLRAIRLGPDGRFGFVVNGVTNTVYIFDVSSNRLVHAVPVGPAADQITFTKEFAYVRSADNAFVTMIKIGDLGKGAGEVAVTRFPAGEKAPRESPASSLAGAIVPAPEDGAVLVANPADKMIYFYTEGMAAPMGSFQNYRRDPKALLVLDNSLRETARGVYATNVRLTGAGHYDVAFLLDSPRLVTCFDLTVAENPDLPKPTGAAIRIEPLLKETTAVVGESYKLRFKVTDSTSNQPKVKLEDMGVLVFLAPGIWQQREWATSAGDGIYEMSFVPPQAGVYYVYFQCPSLGFQFNHRPPLTLPAVKK